MASNSLRAAIGAAFLLVWQVPAASAAPADTPVSVPGSRQIDFTSAITGRPYRLMIALAEAPPPPGGYPVVTVIDGNLYFATVVETMRLQARNFITPAIVVGIGYAVDDTTRALTIRNRDLTLPLTAAQLDAPIFRHGGLKAPEETGGLDDYLKMLRTEVRAKVAVIAPIDPANQVLFGHSLGGLAVLRQLFRDPGAYRGYIASSPSIWFADRAVLRDEAALAGKLAMLPRPPVVLLDVGGTEDSAPRVPADYPISREVMQAEAERIGMVSGLVALGDRLARVPGIDVTTVVFADEDHASVVPAAISRGLRATLRR